jgi:large subunit ribosomal protein L18
MGRFERAKARLRRKKRVRKKIVGTSVRPRLCVFRSSRHIYAQIIDDSTSRTLVEASSASKDLRAQLGNKGSNKEGAGFVGVAIAERSREKGINRVVFDRNGFLYHGRVKALADAARQHGLAF